MLRLILFVLLFALSANTFSQELKFPAQEKIKKVMNASMTTSDLPAVVAIAINKREERISYCFGKAVWSENTNVTEKNIFRIYSMTKLFTSIAALQLVEKGMVRLDDDLSSLLPDMAKIPILQDGKLQSAKKPITLRHLLTHTSGFGYSGTDEQLAKFDRSKWPYKDLPRRFESGTQFLYGSSTDWVGRLVEKLSGLDLENYFRKNITGPLHMDRTWFNLPDSLKPFIVSFGKRGNDGHMPLEESNERIPTKKTKEFSGGGGLFSSPNDFTKLLKCLLNYGELNGVRILKKETVETMNKNQIGNMVLAHPDAYFTPGICCNLNGITTPSAKWGLACMIDTENKSYGRKAGTILWGGLLNTYFFIDYTSGVAASIYTQHLPFNHPATTALFDKFAEAIYSTN